MDELGYVSWDENHRNGQLDQVPWLIKRDRNHPSVVIWSICNEVLCNSKGGKDDALAMKKLMHELDPLGNRPVSANQNGWVGPDTPLDVQVRGAASSLWARGAALSCCCARACAGFRLLDAALRSLALAGARHSGDLVRDVVSRLRPWLSLIHI